MADNDKWLKINGSEWKKAYGVATGYGEACEVAEMLPESVSELLRSRDGLPDFQKYVAVLAPVCGEQRALFDGDFTVAETACQSLAQARCGEGLENELAEIVCRSARGMLLEAQLEGPMQGDIALELARRVLPEIADSAFISRLNTSPRFVERFDAASDGDVLKSSQAQAAFCEEVRHMTQPHFEQLAQALVRDTDGQKLPHCRKRAPQPALAAFDAINISL